jgi:hypothetical protein
MSEPNDNCAKSPQELLPREELGPFILLGLDKDADQAQIEAQASRRRAATGENRARVSAEDIDWSCDLLRDPARRVKADVTSLNTDTAEGTLRGLEESFGLAAPAWQAWELEKPPAAEFADVEIPDPEALRQAITLPPIPNEIPAVAELLEDFARRPLDPWDLDW